MEKRKREILALGLLVLLGIGVASIMAWYMLVGHNWNKAASHIDDLVGSMDGYTVVVFEGILQPASNELSASGSRAVPSSPSGAIGSSDASSSAIALASSNASASSAVASSSSLPAASGSSSSASAKPSVKSSKAANKLVTLKKVVESYREKGATVLTLHLNELSRYGDPMVVSRDGRRYGICASLGKYRYVDVRDKLRDLDAAEVDLKIVVSDSPTIKRGWLRDVDLVVLACSGRLIEGGEYIDGSFFINSPYAGEMQAVIISPSGTITSKTITEL